MNQDRYARPALAGLLLIHILAHIDRNMLLGFSPQITSDLGLSNGQYGFLSGAVWVLSFGVMAILMGTFADRHSRTRVIAAGLLVWSACTFVSGLVHSFEQMVAARLLVATGEAALVPAAVSLIADLFDPRRRSTAVGVFFIGIPVGIGLSFVIASLAGPSLGWRETFQLLGVAGIVVCIPLAFIRDERSGNAQSKSTLALAEQLSTTWAALKGSAALRRTVAAFVLVHFAFASFSFLQLWLVRERGMDASAIARQVGLLQITFGTLGACLGGAMSDRLARRWARGHAGVLASMVAICAPLMIMSRFVAPVSAAFWIGQCAGFFLPLACYGPSLAVIQGLTPASMRSTIAGATMMLINVIAIALGNLGVGYLADVLTHAGVDQPLRLVLLSVDIVVALAAWLYWSSTRHEH